MTQDRIEEVTLDVSNEGGWRIIIEEDFTYGFGLFNRHGNDANHYTSAMNRANVVRIADGEGGYSVSKPDQISLENNSFSTFKIAFSFYAIEMENSDDLCLDCEIDDGAITDKKCWSSLHAFCHSRWYDDTRFEFAASSTKSLRIRLRVEGDDNEVLIDSVVIQGQA